MLKQVCFLLFLFFSTFLLFAQQPDSVIHSMDSVVRTDSFFVKKADSLIITSDSVVKKDSSISRSVSYTTLIKKILKENRFLNSFGKPVAMSNQIKKKYPQDSFFYLLAAIAAILGGFRFFYTRYFNNLFRVFFNASLRQSQLTDQLLQAKLPSLFFNLLFILTGGVYVFLLLRHYKWISVMDFWPVLLYCMLSLGIIYLIKFLTLKFTGWLTGFKEVTDTYVFIIFLINKILGIVLLPFAVIIAFSVPGLVTAAVIISLLLTGLMFLLRFFRSYGLLQHQVKVSRFHFFIYVAGIEIVPVLLIYKGLVLLLSKNL
ncbi:MAG: DUF4271 domain-containing protein [Ferruginibacter sp.]|nr:DUF4271 domain-containing protein [Ferruginibacter sp.]